MRAQDFESVKLAKRVAHAQLAFYRHMMGKKMQEINYLNDLKDFTGLVLFGAHWCSPCKVYKPALESFCEARGIRLGYVDAGKRPDLAGTYGVRGVPTTFFFVNGSPFASQQGILKTDQIEELLPKNE